MAAFDGHADQLVGLIYAILRERLTFKAKVDPGQRHARLGADSRPFSASWRRASGVLSRPCRPIPASTGGALVNCTSP